MMHILQVIQNSHPGPKFWQQSVWPSWAVILAVGSWTWLLGLSRPSFHAADETLLIWQRHIQPHYTRVCVTDDGKWLSFTNRSREWQIWTACLSSNIAVSLVFVFIYVYVYLQNTKLVIYICHECTLQPALLRCFCSRNLALLGKKFCTCAEAVPSHDVRLNSFPLNVIGRYNHTTISNLAVGNKLL